MKRFFLYNGITAIAFLAIWALLVLVEVKVKEFWFLKYVFWASLLLVVLSFPLVNIAAFNTRPRVATVMAFVSTFIVVPLFIYGGVMFIWELKIALGGSK